MRADLYEADFVAWAEAQAEALRAVRLAADETGLPPGTFPDACPFTPDQVLGDWMP